MNKIIFSFLADEKKEGKKREKKEESDAKKTKNQENL